MLVTPYCGLISSLEPEIENPSKDGHLQLADTNPFPRWCPLIRGSTVYILKSKKALGRHGINAS